MIEPAGERDVRTGRYEVSFDDLFHVPQGWLSWRCRLTRSRVEAGYQDGACQYDHNVASWEQLAAETAEHLTRWHPHVRAMAEAGAPDEPTGDTEREAVPEPTTTAEQADSDAFPWVKDFDDVWHLRPRGRGWYVDGEREDGAQAETLCGRWVPSVSVAEARPEALADLDGVVCEGCSSRAALSGPVPSQPAPTDEPSGAPS